MMFVRTKRLMLRPGWIEDAPELARAIGHWQVVRNLGRAPWPYALGDAQAFLEQQQTASTGVSFLICGREGADSPVIGGIGFGPYGDLPFELGYWLTPTVWGRGYATEAGRAVCDLAQALAIPRLTACHYPDNPASGAVLTKLGFRAIGQGQRHCLGRDAVVDCTEYALSPATEARDDGVKNRARMAA